jgi:hypothetical protein
MTALVALPFQLNRTDGSFLLVLEITDVKKGTNLFGICVSNCLEVLILGTSLTAKLLIAL